MWPLCGTKPVLLLLVTACVHVKEVHSSEHCPSLPVFSPSFLVVKFGDPAFATCAIDNNDDIRLEEPLSSSFKIGSQLTWNVTSLKVWDIRPICYIFDSSCREYLTVTVYQPPETVSLSFKDHSGPLVEGRLYSLQCDVGNMAPAQNMTVAFYRGHMELGTQRSSSTQKTPVTESIILDYTVSQKDHGAHFWCEVRLELGPSGPQPSPVVRSQTVTVNVLYAPYSEVPAEPQLLTVFQGYSAELNCSSEGNPDPHYSWTVPSDTQTLFSGSVFTIQSASSQHEGLYYCNASNSEGSLRRSFTLMVHDLPVTKTAAPVVTVTPASHSAEDWSLLHLIVSLSISLCLYCHFTEL